MAGKIPHLDKKLLIRDALLNCARAGRTCYYKELGERVGIRARGPWKGVLDAISKDETDEGRPDITFVVINKKTELPGQIGFKPAEKPSPEQIELARLGLQKVFAKYCPRAKVPF